ncbi:transcriptional regulator [Ruania zhangjianzhongii]|uniref:transcriptional regulator n=1 Tax=Ruania zhangjianzhongii TaxID=2603206 RepID=UPI0011C82FA4|nr:transcriptional regulator [Ruania zhangjianzhongii]
MRLDPLPTWRLLHALRLLGFADDAGIAARVGSDQAEVAEELLDAQSRGWVQHTAFADLDGWSLTDRGKAENERLLADQRQEADLGGEVDAVYREFLPLNARLLRACSDWQLRPADGDPLAANDHRDPAWDDQVLAELTELNEELAPLVGRLVAVLDRFAGYDDRFASALRRAQAGEPGWVDSSTLDSCHRVWFELHEDLIATLGIDRSAEH